MRYLNYLLNYLFIIYLHRVSSDVTFHPRVSKVTWERRHSSNAGQPAAMLARHHRRAVRPAPLPVSSSAAGSEEGGGGGGGGAARVTCTSHPGSTGLFSFILRDVSARSRRRDTDRPQRRSRVSVHREGEPTDSGGLRSERGSPFGPKTGNNKNRSCGGWFFYPQRLVRAADRGAGCHGRRSSGRRSDSPTAWWR